MMQAPLAILGFVFSVAAWSQGASLWWPVGGALLVAVVPFTLIVIMPVNRRLLDPTLDKQSAEAAHLLSRWGQLHAVRSVLSVLALFVLLSARL
jgi:DMSO reductase anchor subunit